MSKERDNNPYGWPIAEVLGRCPLCDARGVIFRNAFNEYFVECEAKGGHHRTGYYILLDSAISSWNAGELVEMETNPVVSVSVKWFHSGLACTFGRCATHNDAVPSELRAAAKEYEKFRDWKCPKGKALFLDVRVGDHPTLDDAVAHEVERVMRMKYMKIDAIGFDRVTPATPQKKG